MCTVVSQAAAEQHTLSGISVVKSHTHKAFTIHILICMQQLRHKPELHIDALRLWLCEDKSTVIRLSSLQNSLTLMKTGCGWVNDDEYSFLLIYSFKNGSALDDVENNALCSLWCLQTESGEYLMCCWLNYLCMCRCRKAYKTVTVVLDMPSRHIYYGTGSWIVNRVLGEVLRPFGKL